MKHFKVFEPWLIFIVCLTVYSLNYYASDKGAALTTGDSLPNSLLAFNWLFNGNLHFENFRNGIYTNGQLYWRETYSGHLNTGYPIGTAIVSFPIYVCFYLFLLITQQAPSIDITSPDFVASRLLFERIAAATIASFTIVLFYQASRLKFSREIALITAFIYAFATELWVIGSQALWQHGATNLLLVAVFLSLLKVNRTEGAKQTLLVLSCGLLGGLLICVRPTNVVFVAAAGIYLLWLYRRQAIFFGLGLSSALISVVWNLYYFRSFIGGYNTLTATFGFSPRQFLLGLSGLLLSPSRGLLVYTPIVALAVPGVMQVLRQSKYRDEKLIILLLGSGGVLVLQYCFFKEWWGGGAYGPRFLTDILPMLCFSMNYVIAEYLRRSEQLGRTLLPWKVWGVMGLLSFSVFVQIVGAFGACSWDGIPAALNLPSHHEPLPEETGRRLWQFQDSQIERSFRSLLFRSDPPTLKPHYAEGLAGKVLQLRDINKQPFSTGDLTLPAGRKTRVYATVENTGTSQWYGYRTGAAGRGEARVRVAIVDAQGKAMGEQRLFVSSAVKPGEMAIALGNIVTPSQPGRYTLTFTLIAERLTTMPQKPGDTASTSASLILEVSPS